MTRVILDTRDLVRRLREDLVRLQDTDYDIHGLMEQLFWCLEHKEDMEGRLANYFTTLMREVGPEDLMIYQVALLRVLTQLNRQLDNAQLYDTTGMLQYRYEKMFVDDVMLIHRLAPIAGEAYPRERVNS